MHTDYHPTPDALQHFVAGTLGCSQSKEVAEHLLTQCEDCSRFLSGLPPVHANAVSPAKDIENLLEQLDTDLAEVGHRSQLAISVADELLNRPEFQRSLLVGNSARFRTQELCQELLSRAWELRFSDPSQMLEICDLAHQVAKAFLAESNCENAHDLLASACGHLANAHRIGRNLRAAHLLFQEAEEALTKGSGDPLETAHYQHLKSPYLYARSEMGEAAAIAEESSSTFSRFGENHWAGMSCANAALAYLSSDRLAAADEKFELASRLICPEREPAASVACKHNRVVVLYERGLLAEALASLKEVEALYRLKSDRTLLLKLRQLEGVIARDSGHVALAEKCFLEARNAFAAMGLGAAAAELSLELASLYSEQGRHKEVRSLADAVVPIFQSCELHQEVIAAMLLFRNSALEESLTAATIAGLLDFVQTHQVDPSARLSAFLGSQKG